MFNAATNQSEIELPEEGRYIATCRAIEEAPDKGFGPGIKWIFELQDWSSRQPVFTSRGEPFMLWQFTSKKMGPKAICRHYIEALIGRALAEGEVPAPRDLLNRAVVALILHQKREDGTMKAVLTSCKPYVEAGGALQPSAPVQAAPAHTAAPVTVADGADRDALLVKVQKAVRNAEVLGTPHHLDWLAMPVDDMSADDLAGLLADVRADIAAAA